MSIAERYPTHTAYVSAVTNAVDELRQQRLLLDVDAEAYIKSAQASTIGD
jgi:hypothetical protein